MDHFPLPVVHEADSTVRRERVPVRPLDIFFSHSGYAEEASERVRRREWRIVSDEEVGEKCRRSHVHSTTIKNFVTGSGSWDLEPPSLRMIERDYLHKDELLIAKQSTPFFLGERRERLIQGSIDTRIVGRDEHISYFAILEGMNGNSCVDYIQENFLPVFTEGFQHIHRPLESPIANPTENISTREGSIWNALKLSFVKLQELWVRWTKTNEGVEGLHPESSASLCAVFFIGSEIWCVTIGSAKAILLNEREQRISYLSPPMTFANSTLTHSIAKRGGTISFSQRIWNSRGGSPLIPQLGGMLPTPRALGAIHIPGVSARPKITRMVFNREEPSTIVLAPESLWETISTRSLLETVSQRMVSESNEERLNKIAARLSMEVLQARKTDTFSCFLLSPR